MKIRIAGALAVLAAATAAHADTVNLDFVGVGAGHNLTIQLAGYNGGAAFGAFAGQINHVFSGGTGVAAGLDGSHFTFCTEITQEVYTSSNPSTTQYTVAPIHNLPSPGVGMGAVREQAIYDLFSYAGAAASAAGANSDYAMAFQVAIWEIVYDGPGNTSLTSGNLILTGLTAGATSYFNTFMSHLDGSGSAGSALGLTSPGFQDQIVAIPLPTGAVLGATGFGLIALTRLRRRS